jgi:hypothetical protein
MNFLWIDPTNYALRGGQLLMSPTQLDKQGDYNETRQAHGEPEAE